MGKKLKPVEHIDIYSKHDSDFYFWKLKYNHQYVVTLHDINRLVYKGTTGSQKGTDLFTSVPGAFSGLKVPAFSATTHITLTSPPPNQNAPAAIPMGAHNYAAVISKRISCPCTTPESLIAQRIGLNRLYSAMIDSLNSLKQYGKSIMSIAAIQDTINALKLDAVDTFVNINSRKGQALKRFQNSIHDTSQLSFILGYKNMIKLADSASAQVDTLVERITDTLHDLLYKSLCVDTTILIKKLNCLKPCTSPDYSYYSDMLDSIRKCTGLYDKKIHLLKDDAEKAEKFLTEVKSDDFTKKLIALQSDYELISEENFEYTVETFIANNDVHDITINVSSPDPLGSNQPQNRVIHVKGITTGGLKLDFSTGAFFNFGNDNFLGPNYYYKTVDSVNKQIIKVERYKKAMFSIGALAHLYWRTYSFVKPALTVGVSTTASFESVNFHGGFSLLFGKRGAPNRIVLTGGITLREVSLLDSRYQLNTSYTDLPDNVPVTKNFPLLGGFFSITYNFFSAASK